MAALPLAAVGLAATDSVAVPRGERGTPIAENRPWRICEVWSPGQNDQAATPMPASAVAAPFGPIGCPEARRA